MLLPTLSLAAGISGDVIIDGSLILINDFTLTANSFTSGAINAVGAAGADGKNLTVNATNGISIGDIDTSGGIGFVVVPVNGGNGGNVTLAGSSIAVGSITTIGGNALVTFPVAGGDGGDITLTATNNSGPKIVTLNGNINTNGGSGAGTAGTATVVLNGTSAGTFNNNHTGVFTTGLTVTSNDSSSDTLNAANAAKTWNLTDVGDGTLNTQITFNNFENLNGGSLNDSFILNNGVNLSGAIDGGGGTNTLIRTDGTNAWTLTAANNGTLTGTSGFSNIQTLTGGSGTDTLTAINQANDWDISALNAGSVQQAIVTPIDTVNFTWMENLTSGTNTDIFTFSTAVSDVSGLMDGNTGSDSLDITALTTVRTVEIGNAMNANLNATGFEVITANSTLANALIGDSTIDNNWDINALNAGQLSNASASTLSFSGFRHLTGGALIDNFVISGANGQLTTGSITGGGGNDSVTGRNTTDGWNLNTADGGILSYDATTTTLSSIESFIGGSATDTLTASVLGAHVWQITGPDAGTVNDLTNGFSNIENLVGNFSVDTFNINGGSLSGNINGSIFIFDILNADSGTNTWVVNSANGSFNLNLNTLAVDNNLTLSAGAIVDANGASNNVQAGLLTITAANGIGSGDDLEIQVNTLDIVNTNSGLIELNQAGDINLSALQNLGNDGDIRFNSSGNINFNPGSSVAALGSGDLIMRTSTGSFLGLADINNPDITAQNATFIGLAGTFGSFSRGLTLNVPGSVVIQTRGSFNPQFVAPGPTSVVSTGIDFSALNAATTVASEQLVEIESLS
ncbi:MAG: hypothetical protein ACI9KN_000828 [Gammaproteobacteria bacterium]